MSKEIINGKNGLKVKLIESKKDGKTKLSAYIIDPETLAVLTKTPKTCTFERDEDRAVKRLGLINKACGDWMKKHRQKGGKSEERKAGEISPARAAFERIDWNDPYFTRRWRAESTRRNARTFFERNVLPFVDCHQGEECTRTDVEEFHAALVDSALKNGHTKGNAAQVRRKMNQHLQEAVLIYDAMLAIAPELPDIDFSPFAVGRAVQSELARSLPEAVRQRFARYLETSVPDAPKAVFAAVLMFDGALRTAEAAGQTVKDVELYDRFGVVRVRYQEKYGQRCPLLKTEAAYRNVTLSFWGKTLIKQCSELLAGERGEGPYLTAKQLRGWITDALCDCGVTEAYMQAARKLMDEEPDYESDGLRSRDIVAYILRKDCCSRWLNICGLQSADVDYLLGHKTVLSNARKANYKSLIVHESIASSLENYIFDPAISAHPYFSPVRLAAGEKRDLPPGGAVSIGRSDGGRGKLTIHFTAREVGAVVELRVPKNCVPKVELRTLPRREQPDQPIIGRQTDSVLP